MDEVVLFDLVIAAVELAEYGFFCLRPERHQFMLVVDIDIAGSGDLDQCLRILRGPENHRRCA